MHRVVWFPAAPAQPGGRPLSGGAAVFGAPRVALAGSYTARLTVNGKSYTRTFTVLPDPRQTDK